VADRIILHIGTHKTGTTAIQKELLQNRELLAKRNIHYPDIGFVYYGHHHFAEQISNNHEKLKEYVKEVKKLSGDVILSSENFSLISKENLANFKEQLGKDVEVIIVSVVRNYLSYSFSWWQETIKHGSKSSLAEFISEQCMQPHVSHVFGIQRLMDNFIDIFGHQYVQIFEYDSIKKGQAGSFVNNFLSKVFNDTLLLKVNENELINASFKGMELETLRRLNYYKPMFDNGNVASFYLEKKGRSIVDKYFTKEMLEPFTKSISLSFDSFFFKQLEENARKSWGSSLKSINEEGTIFSSRQIVLEYIDPIIWSEYSPQSVLLLEDFFTGKIKYPNQKFLVR
jgi:hypothetical protein